MKSRSSKQKIITGIVWLLTWCGLCGCIFYYIGIRCQEKTMESYACYMIDKKFVLTFEQVNNSLSEQQYYEGAYCLLEDQQIYGEDVRRKISLDVVAGNVPWSGIVRINGTWIPEDSYGCLLSSESMYQLFGTDKANGQRVQVCGCDYYVRGVIRSDERLALLPYSKRNAAVMENVSGVILNVKEEGYRDQYADKIENLILAQGQAYYIEDYTTFFGRIDPPKTGTQFFDYNRWYTWIQQQWYRKLYHNKDVLERYYYHISWRHICWQSMILLCVVVQLMVVIRYVTGRRES